MNDVAPSVVTDGQAHTHLQTKYCNYMRPGLITYTVFKDDTGLAGKEVDSTSRCWSHDMQAHKFGIHW